jgi:hypothetical protein
MATMDTIMAYIEARNAGRHEEARTLALEIIATGWPTGTLSTYISLAHRHREASKLALKAGDAQTATSHQALARLYDEVGMLLSGVVPQMLRLRA